jgi:hypothetical protein
VTGVGEHRTVSTKSLVLIMAAAGGVMVVAMLILTAGCLGYKRWTRRSATCQVSGPTADQDTTTRFRNIMILHTC